MIVALHLLAADSGNDEKMRVIAFQLFIFKMVWLAVDIHKRALLALRLLASERHKKDKRGTALVGFFPTRNREKREWVRWRHSTDSLASC